MDKKANPLSGLGGMVGKGFNFMFEHPVGIGAFEIGTGAADTYLDAFGPKNMAKSGIKTPESLDSMENLNKIGSKRMTLKDVLVNKIREAKSIKTAGLTEKTGSLGAPVTDKDVAFVNDITKGFSGSEKSAGLMDFMKGDAAKAGINALGAIGLLGLGGNALGSVYAKVRDAIKSNESYHQMFEEFPNLNEIPREQVDKYWNVLMDFAPQLTVNPLVAGQFIDNMATYGMKGIDHNVVGQLAQISHSINQSHNTGESLKGLHSLGVKAFGDSISNLPEAGDGGLIDTLR